MTRNIIERNNIMRLVIKRRQFVALKLILILVRERWREEGSIYAIYRQLVNEIIERKREARNGNGPRRTHV